MSVKITKIYIWVRMNPQAHRYTVVGLHLRSIPNGIEYKE
jgi:hypothetical protein